VVYSPKLGDRVTHLGRAAQVTGSQRANAAELIWNVHYEDGTFKCGLPASELRPANHAAPVAAPQDPEGDVPEDDVE